MCFDSLNRGAKMYEKENRTNEIEEMKKYYNDPIVREKLFRLWNNRELASFDFNKYGVDEERVYRHHKLESLNYFDLLMQNLKIFADRNLYFTTARFDFIPNIFLGRSKNGKYVLMSNIEFNRIIKENLLAYDIFLDFDIDDIKDYESMKKEVFDLAEILLKNNIQFKMSVSSDKGFHIVIPYEVVKLPFEFEGDTLILYAGIVKAFQRKFNLKYLCTVGNGVYNRLQKSPLTLYKNKMILSYLTYDWKLETFFHTNDIMVNNPNGTFNDFKIFVKKFLM